MSRRGLGTVAVLATLAVATAPAFAQAPSRTINHGVYSAAQATRGQKVYADACANCHGADATGGGGGPTLSGPFWSAWNGRSMGDLYQLVKGSMPMDGAGSLSDQEYADVVAYMLSVNRVAAGTGELSTDGEALKSIAIVPRN